MKKRDITEAIKLNKELIKSLKRLAVLTALFAADCEMQAKYLRRQDLKGGESI